MIVVGTAVFCATDSGTMTGVTTVAVTVARTVSMLRDTNMRVRSCGEVTVWNETIVSTSVVVDVSARVVSAAISELQRWDSRYRRGSFFLSPLPAWMLFSRSRTGFDEGLGGCEARLKLPRDVLVEVSVEIIGGRA